jgi:hypothetical protein
LKLTFEAKILSIIFISPERRETDAPSLPRKITADVLKIPCPGGIDMSGLKIFTVQLPLIDWVAGVL